jgi:transcription elongation factor Elf1
MEDLVPKEWGCPHCGERRIDYLSAPDDDEVVRCETCRRKYTIQLSPIEVEVVVADLDQMIATLDDMKLDDLWEEEEQLKADLRSPPS